MTELLLKEVGQGLEMVEGFLTGRELDKEVDITVGPRLIAQDGSEQRQPDNAKRTNSRCHGSQPRFGFMTG